MAYYGVTSTDGENVSDIELLSSLYSIHEPEGPEAELKIPAYVEYEPNLSSNTPDHALDEDQDDPSQAASSSIRGYLATMEEALQAASAPLPAEKERNKKNCGIAGAYLFALEEALMQSTQGNVNGEKSFDAYLQEEKASQHSSHAPTPPASAASDASASKKPSPSGASTSLPVAYADVGDIGFASPRISFSSSDEEDGKLRSPKESAAAGENLTGSTLRRRESLHRLQLRAPAHARLFSKTHRGTGGVELEAMDCSESQRSWWAELLSLMNLRTETNVSATVERLEAVAELGEDFVSTARHYGKIIISEAFLPVEKKTIKPVNVGGVAGGEKYICQGILFKFAFDACVHTDEQGKEVWMYGMDQADHELAMKAASSELLCLIQFIGAAQKAPTPVPLTVPMVCLIDYLGFRLYASALLPISASTLAYGSADGGRTFQNRHAKLREAVNMVCQRLNLKMHKAGFGDGAETRGPGDLEAHWHAARNTAFIIDFARLFPPESPTPTIRRHFPRSVFFQFLRPEFVTQYAGGALCSDAYSGWIVEDPDARKHNAEVREATRELYYKVIPKLAQLLDEKYVSKEYNVVKIHLEAKQIKLLFHEHGVNLRHLGVVHRCCTHPAIQHVLLNEMVARTLKADLRARVRGMMQHVKVPSATPYRRLVVDSLNIILQHSKRAEAFWCDICPQEMERRFQFAKNACALPKYLSQDHAKQGLLLCNIDRHVVLDRFSSLSGVKASQRLTESIRVQCERKKSNIIHDEDMLLFQAMSPFTEARMTDVRNFGVIVKNMAMVDRAFGAALFLRSRSINASSASELDERNSLLFAAVSKLKQARLRTPQDVSVLNLLGLVKLDMARLELDSKKRADLLKEASESFQTALLYEPQLPEAMAMLGDVQLEQGLYGEAQISLGKAYDMDPKHGIDNLLRLAEESFEHSTLAAGNSFRHTMLVCHHLIGALKAVIKQSFEDPNNSVAQSSKKDVDSGAPKEEGTKSTSGISENRLVELKGRLLPDHLCSRFHVILRCTSLVLLRILAMGDHALIEPAFCMLEGDPVYRKGARPVSPVLLLWQRTSSLMDDLLSTLPDAYDMQLYALASGRTLMSVPLTGRTVKLISVPMWCWIKAMQNSRLIVKPVRQVLLKVENIPQNFLDLCNRNDEDFLAFLAAELTGAKHLNLSGHRTLKDSFLKAFSSPALETLVLPGSRAISMEPLTDFLARHPKLKSLTVEGMPCVNDQVAEAISNLHHLQYLYLENSSFTDEGFETLLKNCGHHLETITIRACSKLTEKSAHHLASYAHSLQKLVLFGVRWKNIDGLKAWKGKDLVYFELRNASQLDGTIFDSLPNSQNLKTLVIDSMPQVFKKHEVLQGIGDLALESLIIPNAQLVPDAMQHIRGKMLTTLVLSKYYRLSEKCILDMRHELLPSLTHFDISDTKQVTHVGFAHIAKEWPQLLSLTAQINDDASLVPISTLHHLQALRLTASSYVKDEFIAPVIKNCKQLKKLLLRKFDIRDESIGFLTNTIQHLELGHCRLVTFLALSKKGSLFHNLESLRVDTLFSLRDACLVGFVLRVPSLKRLCVWQCNSICMISLFKLRMALPDLVINEDWQIPRVFRPLQSFVTPIPYGIK